jgi:protein TonB
MARGWTGALYAVSLGAHALLGLGVASIHEPAPPPTPVHIVVREVPRARPSEPPPAPEPPPPAPEAPPPVAPPTPAPARPAPRAEAPSPPPAPAPAPAPSPPPAFGLALSGAVGAGGVAVPVGDPSGTPGGTGTGERTTRTAERRALEAPAPAAEPSDGCGEAAVRPRALEMPRPAYTDAARAAGIEGRVRVEVHVGADGSVEDVRVVSPLDPDLDEAALAAVRGARFSPQTRCGVAEPTTFTIGVSFSL